MTLLVSAGLSFLGLSALCLSLSRHHQAVWSAPPDRRRALALRAAGWVLVALSLAAAIGLDGGTFGPVHWLGSLIAAGLCLIVALSYRPRAVVWMAPAAAVLAAVAALGSMA
ncbi:hypothetical protein VQ02_02965 [Methylobacterium variabile]|jgi:hypothetical protein|uniref:Iron transporter n=1 Tax=Methylobacterium variabile TaxID=298794 RepID=A0A0J6T9B1_9HYPH|nr:DUF3325 domain-containing protein [Methylobacterium variabile]KMO42477.1 hypothetical protein VQ02_02965 [Methylobacterium variabile]